MGGRACKCVRKRGSDDELGHSSPMLDVPTTGPSSAAQTLSSTAAVVGTDTPSAIDAETPITSPAASTESREARDAAPPSSSCTRSIPDVSAEMEPHPEVTRKEVGQLVPARKDGTPRDSNPFVKPPRDSTVPARKDSYPTIKPPRDSTVTAVQLPVKSTSRMEKDRFQTLARKIDGYFHTEMSLQHCLTVIDTVPQSINEAGSEIQAEQLWALVNEKANQCHRSLQEAYKIRLEAREAEKEDSSTFMEKANSAHTDALQVVQSLFKPCRALASLFKPRRAFVDISEVRKAAKAKYDEVAAKLDHISELKLPVMEELADSQEKHKPILGQLACFADGAVQMAMANPQHAALRYNALRSVVRYMRMSDGIAGCVAAGGCSTKEWRDFAEMALSESRGDPRWDDIQRDACTILGRAG